MSRGEILAKLTAVFRDVFDDDDLILTEATTRDDVEGWDSLANINLVVSIEDEFNISFSMDNIVDIKTVGDLADVVMEGL